MRSFKIFVLSLGLFMASGSASAGVDIGLSIDKDGIKGFYLAIGDHYSVSEKVIVEVRQQKIPDEDLPVVFFLARNANVKPGVIIKLRLSGKTWMEIALHYGLTAEIFYVPLANPGPPYGKAWGHAKKKHKERVAMRLSDGEIVASVNLRFISDHYGYPPDEVAKLRREGKSYISINAEVKKKKGRSGSAMAKKAKGEKNSKPKGKGKKDKK